MSWFYQYQRPRPDTIDPCQFCGGVNVPGELTAVYEREGSDVIVDVWFWCAVCFRREIQSLEQEAAYNDG
jgi:hypothetical protein